VGRGEACYRQMLQRADDHVRVTPQTIALLLVIMMAKHVDDVSDTYAPVCSWACMLRS
jgi:hypothetical protein